MAALAPLAPWLAGFPDSAKDDDRVAQALMRRHGIPKTSSTVLGPVADASAAYGLRDGRPRRSTTATS